MATRKRTDLIVVHCSATKPDMDIGAAEIDKWHRAKGWLCIGYHKVIRRDGTIEDGRDIDAPGAHVEGLNAISVGICLVGGIDDKGKPEANFTQAQYDSLKKLLRTLQKRYPGARICGHRDLLNPRTKECPCFDVNSWYSGHLG